MKDKCIIAGIVILFLGFVFMLHDAKAVESVTMEKINRVQTLYDEGIKLHNKGSIKHGCYLVRQAVREAWMIQGDDKFTFNQIEPLYKELCEK
jgi:hypothetical protein